MMGEPKKNEEIQQRNLESIKELRKRKPFKTENITDFYKQHQGNDPNSFIKTDARFRDYHDAIYCLLLFLDQPGHNDLYLDTKKQIFVFTPNEHEIRFSDYVLDTTKIMVRFLKFSKHELTFHANSWNIRMLLGGIAALSCNISLGLGHEFNEHYNNNFCEASLAILEQMPMLSRLRDFEKIKTYADLFNEWEVILEIKNKT